MPRNKAWHGHFESNFMDRKQFSNNISTGLLGVGVLNNEAFSQKTIQSIGVKITNIKPYIFSNALYVKVETDAGISGRGEGDHENTGIIGKFIEEVLIPVLIGQEPFDSEYLWHQLFFEGFESGSTGINPGAVAGIDNSILFKLFKTNSKPFF